MGKSKNNSSIIRTGRRRNGTSYKYPIRINAKVYVGEDLYSVRIPSVTVEKEFDNGLEKWEDEEIKELDFDGELPVRGTGRRIGTAKRPTGIEGRLTEKERKKRHERIHSSGYGEEEWEDEEIKELGFDGELPVRGTGRRIGTAKRPTGIEGRLTEKERKKRHERIYSSDFELR